jgi:hypothetical protein
MGFLVAGDTASDSFVLHTNGAANVTYGATVAGTIGAGVYLLDVTIERVG